MNRFWTCCVSGFLVLRSVIRLGRVASQEKPANAEISSPQTDPVQ